ncbi:unnamed protein product [marine sediment metagenome]|uniref:Uncharacterized protein n=1 Tax=marine sediment metagenome TaxID=412755 RepID=X1S2J1_9ZZZZ
MACICGHTQYAHDFGKGKCAVKGCKCKKFSLYKKSNYPVYDEKTDEVYKP